MGVGRRGERAGVTRRSSDARKAATTSAAKRRVWATACSGDASPMSAGDNGGSCAAPTRSRHRTSQRGSGRAAQTATRRAIASHQFLESEREAVDGLRGDRVSTGPRVPAGLGLLPCRDRQPPGRAVRPLARSRTLRHRPRCPHAPGTRPCTELPAALRRRAWCMWRGRGSEQRH
jgi:hypothetical protein